jgi:hypothetical protein
MKKTTIQENLEQAKADRTNQKGNFNGRAINTTSDAEKGQQELKNLIDERGKLKGNGDVKSSQALAAELGSYRFLAWLFWALIVDVCPLYAIHQLGKAGSDTKSGTRVNSDTLMQLGTIEKKSRQGMSGGTQKGESLANSDTSTVEGATNHIKQYNRVCRALLNNEVKPGKNAVRTQFNLGTATVDKIFYQLIENNIIQRSANKKTYELVKSKLPKNETIENKAVARPA